MRKVLAPEIERARCGGAPNDGPMGAFRLLHPESGKTFLVIASDGRDWAQEGLAGPPWEHVSVSGKYAVPTWAEMCWVKDQFFEPTEWAVQYHPAAGDYVNTHPFCLHLWKLAGAEFPTPPKECV